VPAEDLGVSPEGAASFALVRESHSPHARSLLVQSFKKKGIKNGAFAHSSVSSSMRTIGIMSMHVQRFHTELRTAHVSKPNRHQCRENRGEHSS
jgi:hypothetical protein